MSATTKRARRSFRIWTRSTPRVVGVRGSSTVLSLLERAIFTRLFSKVCGARRTYVSALIPCSRVRESLASPRGARARESERRRLGDLSKRFVWERARVCVCVCVVLEETELVGRLSMCPRWWVDLSQVSSDILDSIPESARAAYVQDVASRVSWKIDSNLVCVRVSRAGWCESGGFWPCLCPVSSSSSSFGAARAVLRVFRKSESVCCSLSFKRVRGVCAAQCVCSVPYCAMMGSEVRVSGLVARCSERARRAVRARSSLPPSLSLSLSLS